MEVRKRGLDRFNLSSATAALRTAALRKASILHEYKLERGKDDYLIGSKATILEAMMSILDNSSQHSKLDVPR